MAENRIARHPHFDIDTSHGPVRRGGNAPSPVEIGHVHIALGELRQADGATIMFVALDRVSKFAFVAFQDSAGERQGSAFLGSVLKAFPYRVRTVLTDNSIAFTDRTKVHDARRHRGQHGFERLCVDNAIGHRRIRPFHPWTRNEAHQMSRAIEDATVRLFRYDDLGCLKAHVLAFVAGYNSAKPLKALAWRTPHQAICDAWAKDPSVFKVDPHGLIAVSGG